ncbi:MAG: hypothetical protein CVV13_01375 [Gammaproteobacteria bacterium HGW-Gammaproteobacteria-3]|jgi:quercetin dioxygenase-like cupin family protein|nr:MAG: hypothetical protein CVV13_01375 [Gammaproteobacteria bacterium HGW-Gammaproteobacteria-3]
MFGKFDYLGWISTGHIECVAIGTTQLLASGQLLYLMPDNPHSVKAVVDSVVLLTIIFKD